MAENSTNQITPIFREFIQSYSEKDAAITDQEWLKGMLKDKELEITDEELDKYAADLVGSVKSFSESLRSLEESRAEGKSAAEWLQEKAKESGKEISTEELQQLNLGMEQANARVLRNAKAEEAHQTVNASAIDLIAEQKMIDSFNANAVSAGAEFEAEIDYPAEDSKYGHNLFDVVIKDKFNGRRLENYQIIYGKDLQETIDLVIETPAAKQRIVVPEDMVAVIQKECPFHKIVSQIGGTDSVQVASDVLCLDENLDALDRAIPPIVEKLVTDPAETISEIADKTFSAGVFSAGLQQGIERLVDGKEVEDFSAKEWLSNALMSEDTDGIKTAAAGALATVVHKGLVSVLPKDAPAVVVADLASVGVENVKMLAQVADGAMSIEDSIEHMGNMNVAMGFEYVWNTYAAPYASRFLSAIPVIGPIISNSIVGRQIVNLVKTPIKELVVEGAKQIIPTVKKVAKKAMKAGKKLLKAGKKLLKSIFS